MNTRELTCIGCPLGCAITVTMDGSTVTAVTGFYIDLRLIDKHDQTSLQMILCVNLVVINQQKTPSLRLRVICYKIKPWDKPKPSCGLYRVFQILQHHRLLRTEYRQNPS